LAELKLDTFKLLCLGETLGPRREGVVGVVSGWGLPAVDAGPGDLGGVQLVPDPVWWVSPLIKK
jgi:hypothetical protein